jgi:hypothetical protein
MNGRKKATKKIRTGKKLIQNRSKENQFSNIEEADNRSYRS